MKFLILLLFLATARAERIDPRLITHDSRSVIVPRSWMDDYIGLEKRYGAIPEDHLIWKDKGRFHIPVAVAKRYLELKKK